MKQEGGNTYVKLWVAVGGLIIGMFAHGAVAVAYLHSTFLSKAEFASQQVVRDKLIYSTLVTIDDDIKEMKDDLRVLRDKLESKQDKGL